MVHAFDLTVKTIVDMVDGFFKLLPNLLIGTFIVFLFIRLSRYVQRIVMAIGSRAALDMTLARALANISSVAATIFGILIAATVVFPSFKAGHLVAGLGITSVAIGFAFKDMLQNFFAGLLLLWQKPFKIGDHIKSKDFDGVVEAIEIHSTRLTTPSGQLVVLPNGDVFTNPIVVNTAYEKFRSHLTVACPPQLSMEGGREEIMKTVASTEGVLREPPPRVYVANVEEGLPKFEVYFWSKPHEADVLQTVDRVATALRRLTGNAVTDSTIPQAEAAGQTRNAKQLQKKPQDMSLDLLKEEQTHSQVA
jgi:small-conductance mechanosensitive channel